MQEENERVSEFGGSVERHPILRYTGRFKGHNGSIITSQIVAVPPE